MEKSRFKWASLGAALLIVLLTVFLMLAVYFRVLRLHILIGEFNIHHWLSWTGTLFIAFFTPAYYFLKRRYPQKFRTLLNVHVFGSLLAVMFVSIHFIQEISRPTLPPLGTGIVLYPAMILLTLTGFFLRFQGAPKLTRQLRFLHGSVAVSFYLIILVHVLHGLEII